MPTETLLQALRILAARTAAEVNAADRLIAVLGEDWDTLKQSRDRAEVTHGWLLGEILAVAAVGDRHTSVKN